MVFQVVFRCGHQGAVKEGQEPICSTCGRYGVARTLNAPPPRIVGTAYGPLVKTEALSPAVVTIGESRLSLKVDTHGDE